MKDRIARAKKFVRDHNHGLATAGGLIVGAAVSYRYLNPTQDDALRHLRLTVDQAKTLLDKPNEMCVSYELPHQLIHVFVDADKQ